MSGGTSKGLSISLCRYAALLRGVSPMNAKMPALKAAFESAGFVDVKTMLSSGNVVFSSRSASASSLEQKAEAAMASQLGRSFFTVVRSVDTLRGILAADPWARFRVEPNAKRVVSFLRAAPRIPVKLPIEGDGARIHALDGCEVLTSYVPNPKGPVFMSLIQRTFGDEVTTRTWDTLKKIAS